MLGLRTSKTRAIGNRPPTGPFVLNKDSWQAQGLHLWIPGFNAIRKDLSEFRRVPTITEAITKQLMPGFNTNWLKFDGIDSVMDFGTYPFQSSFSMCSWIRPAYTGARKYQSIISRGSVFENATNFSFGIREQAADSHRPFIYARSGSTLKGVESASWTANFVLQHIAATWTSGAQNVFRNAVSVATDVDINGTDGSQTLKVGMPNVNASSDGPFSGSGADIRLYNYKMIPEQIEQIYEPYTRWDLFYQLGVKSYFIPAAAATTGNLLLTHPSGINGGMMQ